MATAYPPTSQNIQTLLGKLSDPDPDHRFMSLSDLSALLEVSKSDILKHDYNTAARSIDAVVKALDDQNGEVQNQAKKCLAPLVRRIPTTLYSPLMEKLSTLKIDASNDATVPAVAIRSVIEAFPRPIPGAAVSKEAGEAYQCISKVLIPRLLGKASSKTQANVRIAGFGAGAAGNNADSTSDSVDVLVELIKCFGTMLQSVEVEALNDSVFALMNDEKASTAVRKKAVVALSILAIYLSDDVLSGFIAKASAGLQSRKIKAVTRRLYFTLLGSMARSIPYRFGKHIAAVAPLVLAPLSDNELQGYLAEVVEGDDPNPDYPETREAALVALDAFLGSCPTQMRPFTEDAIGAALRYLKFDPNYSIEDDEDMEEQEEDEDDDMDALEEDDEFETGDAFDDDDDASWKVRRCAAKVISTLISTRSNGDLLEDGVLYRDVVPTLIRRFNEREENVRLEVIAATDLLIRKTGQGLVPVFNDLADSAEAAPPQPSKKRRRQDSVGVSNGNGLVSPVFEKPPATGPRADLVKLTPSLVKACTQQLKAKTLPTKQATVSLLDDLALVQQGGLSDHLDQILSLVLGVVEAPTTGSTAAAASVGGRGASSATPATLRIVALRLLGDIARTHSSSLLQPSLTKLVSTTISAIHDKFYKTSSEAISTASEIVKAITPPRSQATAQENKAELGQLYDVILERANANDADAEVRQNAITVLGVLLARTSSAEAANLLPAEKRQQALRALSERLQNETTRAASIGAVDAVASASWNAPAPFDKTWASLVAVELSDQLRKSNRSLRTSGIQALKHLVLSPAAKSSLDSKTISSLVTALQHVISQNDATLLGPALQILAHLASSDAKLVVSPILISSLCDLLKTSMVASAVSPLLDLVCTIGAAGAGQKLMADLLQNVGVNGDPATVGRVIGALLVSGGDSSGVKLENFVDELKTNSQDTARASLALSVLGEAGLRLGSKSPLKPDVFLAQMTGDYDKVTLTAAQSLGRAAAGNPAVYMPVMLKELKAGGSRQYLVLQATKELLQHDVDIASFADPLWTELLTTTSVEDNKAVCAECVGRMATIDPKKYIPMLDQLLKNQSAAIRSVAIQALRYSLPDSGGGFDAILRNHLVGMLSIVLQDPDMETRRLGMTAFNAASHHKPDLVLPHLAQLMPFVLMESVIKPELIREVQMGPFKHLVDDGLEVRKSAYETLYAMIDLSRSRIPTSQIFDRVMAGLRDDFDIRALSNLMLTKLVALDPEESSRRLDTIAEAYRATLSTKLKNNAVKQEVERQEDANKSVLRVTLLLGDKMKSVTGTASSGQQQQTAALNSGSSQVWLKYWDWVNHDFKSQLDSLRRENEGVGQTHG